MLINERPEENRNPSFDNEASLREADSRFGLERVIEQYGYAPQNGNWKSFACPFCKKKSKAGVFTADGVKIFKCQSTSCPSESKAMPAVQFIAFQENLSNKDAFVVYLKQAGVWKERTHLRGPSSPPAGTDSLPKKQDPGAVSPGNGAPKAAGDRGDTESDRNPTSLQGDAAVDAGVQKNEPAESATEKSAVKGAAANSDGLEVSQGATANNAKADKPGGSESDIPAGIGPAVAGTNNLAPSGEVSPGVMGSPDGVLGPGGASNSQSESGGNTQQADSSTASGSAPPRSPVGVPAVKTSPLKGDPDGKTVLLEFFEGLKLSGSDKEILWKKRGLEYRTSEALRFRSSSRDNRPVLITLEQKYGREELLLSGLWLPADKKRQARPNSQYCGLGNVGKRSQTDQKDTGEDAESGEFLWGWCNPILIPYFDEGGKLVSLRPHKGMGRKGTVVGTPQLYIPRGLGGPRDGAVEEFRTVVITEGEFKAAALWQILGSGRLDGKDPVGVVGFPGITFAKNFEIREALDDWLRHVKCGLVIVVYDNEEKSDPKLESFKEDMKKRFDSQIWARYLAMDISQKLHIKGRVGNLPVGWRNSKGKADWDGAMAMFAHKGEE